MITAPMGTERAKSPSSTADNSAPCLRVAAATLRTSVPMAKDSIASSPSQRATAAGPPVRTPHPPDPLSLCRRQRAAVRDHVAIWRHIPGLEAGGAATQARRALAILGSRESSGPRPSAAAFARRAAAAAAPPPGAHIAESLESRAAARVPGRAPRTGPWTCATSPAPCAAQSQAPSASTLEA